MSGTRTSLWVWLGLALVVIIADQLTKTLIIGQFALHDTYVVAPFFNIVRAHNAGAAFSFLAGAAGWQRWFFLRHVVARHSSSGCCASIPSETLRAGEPDSAARSAT
jgi:lipoprotein signal peptidase